MQFFTQLKQRKVPRVASVYITAGTAVIAFADIVFRHFGWPNWSLTLVIVLALLGFPIALVFAWFFAGTPGTKAPEDASPNILQWSRGKFAALIISLAIAAGGLLVLQFVWKSADKSIAVPPLSGDKSIAILSLSGDTDNPLFAVGLQDDVLNNLAKIKELKVISRASVQPYSDKARRNLAKIGQELRVSRILEGSVHRYGNGVLAKVQLFDTAGDKPIWEKDYDRTPAEFLTLSNELASDIARELRVPLSQAEKARLNTKLTDDLEAWVSYHTGRGVQLRPESSKKDYSTASDSYEKAIRLDPGFVLARARLSFMQTLIFQFFDPENVTLLAEARKNADKALSQDADCAEAHLALARCAQQERNEALVRSELAHAVRLLPNDASLRKDAAVTQQQMGWEDEAAENYENAKELGPREARIFFNYGHLLYETGQQDKARPALDQAVALEPESIYYRIVRFIAEISWSGDIGHARKILAGLPAGDDSDGRIISAKCTLAILKRDFPEALNILMAYTGENLPAVDSGGLAGLESKVAGEGTIRLYAGERARAIECFESLRPSYEEAVRNDPESAIARAQLALLYAVMGEKELAIAEAARAKEKKTPAAGPVKRGFILGLAKAYAWAGEPDLAWEQIEQFQALPASGYSKHNFRLEPAWDPIRNDPRFQELIR